MAAREARLQEVPWALDPLDFRFIGSVVRAKRGPLSTYVHVRAGGDLSVDEEGVPHDVRLDRAMQIRTKQIGISAAVWRTGLVEEELAREPAHRAIHPGWETCESCQVWLQNEDQVVSRRSRTPAMPPPPIMDVREPRLRVVR